MKVNDDKIIWNGGNTAGWVVARSKLANKFKEEQCWELIEDHELFDVPIPEEVVQVNGEIDRELAENITARNLKIGIINTARIDGILTAEQEQGELMKVNLDHAEANLKTNAKLPALQKDFRTMLNDWEFKRNRYRKKVARGLKVYSTHLGDSSKAIIRAQLNDSDVFGAWGTLNTYYMDGNTLSSTSQMIESLSKLKWDTTKTTLAIHIGIFEELVANVIANGVNLDEPARLAFLRNSINISTFMFKNTLQVSDQLNLGYEATKRSLLHYLEANRVENSFEDTIEEPSTDSRGKVTNGTNNQQRNYNNNKTCYTCGGIGHISSQCYNNNNSNNVHKIAESNNTTNNNTTGNNNNFSRESCTYCGRNNHTSDKCWFKNRNNTSNYNQSNKDQMNNNNNNNARNNDDNNNAFIHSQVENKRIDLAKAFAKDVGNKRLEGPDHVAHNRMVREVIETEPDQLSDYDVVTHNSSFLFKKCAYEYTSMLKVPRQIVNVNNYDGGEVTLEALKLLNEADMTFNDYNIISVTNDENMSCG